MDFVTTDEQLKKACSAVTVDLSLDSVQSFLVEAESDFIRIIGTAAKDELKAHANHLATEYIRAAAVSLALAEYSSSGALLIQDSGMHVSKSDHLLPASDKKIVAFKRDSYRRGWEFFEKCISQMEADTAAFPNWKVSVEREKYMQLFVDFSFEFDMYSKVKITADLFQRMRSEIRKVEVDIIAPVLGSSVFTELKSKKNNGGLAGIWQELMERVLRVLGPLSVSEALPYQMVEVAANGVYQLSEMALSSTSDNIEQRNMVQQRVMASVMNRLITEGEAELERLRKWLNKHIGDFPGYIQQSIAPMADINDGLEDSSIYFL